MNDPTQQFYETFAREYESLTKRLQPTQFLRRFIETLPTGAKVLDVGCAYGRDCLAFTNAGFSVTGIDYSETLLGRARALVPKATFLRQDMRELTFPESTFDGIWACASLIHLKKSEFPLVLRTLHSILKPNGILALIMKVGEGEALEPDQRYAGSQKFFAYYSEHELQEYLRNATFNVEWLQVRKGNPTYHPHQSILEVLARKIP